jgi:KaiC/GvpD/RAD55 family RecA-like ATPase
VHRLQRLSPTRLAASTPLPDVLGLAAKFPGARFRRGQTSLVAAEPNNGKSPLVRWMCVQWALQGLHVLYFSADSDEYTTWKSVASAVTGQPASYLEHSRAKTSAALGRLGGRLAFTFETDPSYKDILEESAAFFELWGKYPDAIVIDLLADVQGENEDEYAALREHTRAFKRLARVTDAHVLMVNHVNEHDRKGDSTPPPRAQITGKISKKPELVITLAYDAYERLMKVAVVKNRDGSGTDTSGQTYLVLKSDPERMQFHDPHTGQRLGVAA